MYQFFPFGRHLARVYDEPIRQVYFLLPIIHVEYRDFISCGFFLKVESITPAPQRLNTIAMYTQI